MQLKASEAAKLTKKPEGLYAQIKARAEAGYSSLTVEMLPPGSKAQLEILGYKIVHEFVNKTTIYW